MQSKANNHAVREAACACIAELMIKVDPDAVRPHVPKLLSALLLAFKDASWPVSTRRPRLVVPGEGRTKSSFFLLTSRALRRLAGQGCCVCCNGQVRWDLQGEPGLLLRIIPRRRCSGAIHCTKGGLSSPLENSLFSSTTASLEIHASAMTPS